MQREELTLRGALSAVAIVGALAGIADAACVLFDLYYARRGKAFVPWTIWPVDVLLVVAWCLLLSAPFLFRLTRRWAAVVAVYAGPATLFYLRALPAKVAYWPNAGFRRYGVAVALVFLPFASLAFFLLGRSLVQRLLHRSFTALIVIVCACGVAIGMSRVSLTKRGPTAGTGRNIVLIFLDAVRADSLTPDLMPNITRFARRGTRFTRAFAPSSWTLPSHLSVVTGVPAHQLPVDAIHQSIDRRFTTLAERFHASSYRTAAILANWFPNEGSGMQRGYDVLEYPRSRLDFERTGLVTLGERTLRYFDMWLSWDAENINQRARSFIAGGQPYFVTLNYLDAHAPFYLTRNCSRRLQVTDRFSAYRNAVWCMDESVGRLLRDLEPDVDRGRTVVAIVADHGEQFGEHGRWSHGDSLYAQLVHVPMIIRGARFPATEIRRPVSATGLYDSLLIASRGNRDASAALERQPVVSFLRRPPESRGQQVDLWSLVEGRFHFIADARGSRALYDLDVDPQETANLWNGAGTSLQVHFEERLAAARAETAPALPPDSPFRGLGYLH